ncbi:sucrose-specific PTS transporter subunit IIBC [Vagococcus vulneris]|uniref:PTS system sucrose-specific EIIBCA component n=1 Tax=Vagococcus vulneris TaxID=1977869 RepID=A0A429ZU98_9ENTE|nr:sucrose-specific PTS transporter subunit IIBC [Vagococcus vulneris]RST97319.1 PTS beta-glucoside transporter subunit EIIBCA [Vagococcus vulneris]
MNHKKVAEQVYQAIGKDNIQAAAHCATRLRLVLKDPKKVDHAALDNIDDVKGTFEANGQFQIIIGPGDVDYVYKELTKMAHIKEASTEDIKEAARNNGKTNPVMSVVKVLSDIFVPIIPALVAGGLLMAINNVLTSQNLFGPQSVVEMFPAFKDLTSIINLLASAPFAFLPILVGFSATKRFGGNPYLGAAIGMAMVMPDLVNGYGVANAMADGSMPFWNIFGLNVAQAGYQGSVLPIVAVAWILANLEKFFHKRISKAFDFTFTPMLALIITGFLTFILVGPAMRAVSDGLTSGLVWLYDTTGAIGLGIFGLFYSPIVITGLHQTFPAIETTLLADIAKTGGSFIFPVASMANIAQGAACLAVFFMTKNEKQKSLSASASLSALLGITEPAIFGVNLKLKFPFFCAMIASAIASAVIGLFKVLAVAMGPAGVIGFISISPKSIPVFIFSGLLSLVLSFIFTVAYAKKKNVFAIEGDTLETVEIKSNDGIVSPVVGESTETIDVPITGQIISLSDVNDPVFSTGMMGDGIGITPESDDLYAPISGELTVYYETKHAFGLKSNTGIEVLIHVGIDTVELNGQYFDGSVIQGQMIEKGDKLGSFDRKKIAAAGFDTTVIMVVTNSASYDEIRLVQKSEVKAGDTAIIIGGSDDNGTI